MNSQKLKVIVLYSSGHLGSSILLNQIKAMSCYQIVAIVKTETVPISWQGFLKSLKHLQKTGWRLGLIFAWQRLCCFLIKAIAYSIPFYKERLSSSEDIASHLGVPMITAKNINSKEVIAELAVLEPDLLISACFAQILRKEALALPKIGSLNVHPGILPNCRGAMSYFHCLAQKHHYAGVTVHWIDEGIDTGEVISQSQFRLSPQMTQQTVLAKAALQGAKLLKHAGQKILKDEELKEEIKLERESHYYSVPDARDFQKYSLNHRFFRIRDSFRLFLKRV